MEALNPLSCQATQIKPAIRVDTDHDFIDITGDLIIEGGELCVSMIDDFKLRRGQNS